MSDKHDPIWGDDKIGRRDEADLIANYVKGVSRQALRSPNLGATTLAVDGSYGVGKSFFLSRLRLQLSAAHPVAYVDAWADDLADEPLTALVATLKKAVEPLISKSPEGRVADRFRNVMRLSGRVAKLASIGAVKRAAAIAITTSAVDGIVGAFQHTAEDVKDSLKDGVGDLGKDTVAGTESFLAAKPTGLMDQRVREFEAGQAAMDELKQGLAELVDALATSDVSAPIVIIIDELDRCRPTYAIKLLEEIKHLFDVAGLVFIFGMHGDALATSVRAAYGADFEGAAYLKRFVQRKYVLAEKPKDVLIKDLLAAAGVKQEDFAYFEVMGIDAGPVHLKLHELLSSYARAFRLEPRDISELIDILATAVALAGGQELHLPVLLPLAIAQIRGDSVGAHIDPYEAFPWQYVVKSRSGGAYDSLSPRDIAIAFWSATTMSWTDLARSNNLTPIQHIVFGSKGQGHVEPLTSIKNYPRLLKMVASMEPAD